ncbi:MAG: type II toxin-antitoxin system Phd/YefM family antitoxin [Acidobacteriaceae bacterium]|nr:type II toxin-antitoxin system Phd/YefM family antitoxin [Acidobacteriaceae bacterium]
MMKRVPAGIFKAQCLSLMDTVHATGEPVVVTKRGKPLVKVVPVRTPNNRLFGYMKGKIKIVGDIETPIPVRWNVLGR